MLFHLFLLVLIIFTLFFFYTDVMNKINTNKPFAEGFGGTRDARNDSKYKCSTGSTFSTYSAYTLTPSQQVKAAELYPGKEPSYYACVQGCSGSCVADGDGVMKDVEEKQYAEYMGKRGGYDYNSVDAANAKCEEEGLQLCSKDDVIAGARTKDALENQCSSGWTKDAPRGWYSVKGRSGCGSNNNWNTWAPSTGKGSAHCCKPVETTASAVPAAAAAPNGYTYTGESQCQDWNSHYVACQTALDGTSCSIKATTIDECAAECNKRDSCGEMYFKNGVCYLADGKCVPQTNPTNPQPHYKKGSSVNAPTTYFKTENNKLCSDVGKDPITTSSECKQAAEKLNLTWSNDFDGNGDHPSCLFSNDGRSKVHFNTSSTPGGAKPNYQSLCKNKPINAPASVASAGMNITSSTKETSSVDPNTGAKVTEKCVTVSQLDSASKWVDHLFGTLSTTKCADKDKVMAAKTASKTDFIAGVIKGFQNDRQASTDYYMSAIDKAKPMLDAAFDVNTQNVATANSQHPLLQGGEGGEEGIEDAPNQHSLAEGHTQNNVTANMANGATDGLNQHSSVPSVTTLEDQLKQTPTYQQAMNQISKNDNYEMANGNLVQPATGTCPNGCKAPQYDNEKCTNQMIGGKAYRSCPWIGDGSINDSMCKDCGSILMPKNEYGYARTRPGLFSKNTLHNILAGTQFNKEPEKPNADYVNIGLQFMTELSIARNFRLPYIPQGKYEVIGKIVHKYQLTHNNSTDSKKELSNIINGLFNSDKIPTTINSINNGDKGDNSRLNGAVSSSIQPNEDAFTLQNTLNEPSTNEDTERSEKIIKGLMGADNFYKSSAQGVSETKRDNRLGGSKTLFDQSNKHSGYTTKYRPQDPRQRPKPYDSIWSLY